MKENRHLALARHRLQRAADSLTGARQNYVIGNFRIAVSQSYYRILTAMRALLALRHVDSHLQEGAITLFHKHYVQKRLFPKEVNKVIKDMKTLREEADYGDFVEVTKEMAEREIKHAEGFFKAAEIAFARLLSEKGEP